MKRTTDVVVVGASIAGCTAARLLAQQGAEVTLVEKRPDLDAYKVVCTHYIQPSALPGSLNEPVLPPVQLWIGCVWQLLGQWCMVSDQLNALAGSGPSCGSAADGCASASASSTANCIARCRASTCIMR